MPETPKAISLKYKIGPETIVINQYFNEAEVSADYMDMLWRNGWRHFGSYFYRYSILPKHDRVLNVLPLRIRLDKFRFSRSHKRILKKNSDLKVVFKPAFVNEEVTALFEKHKKRFKENIPESIHVFVSRKPATVPCEAESLCLYKDSKLLGISYFDLGKQATSSVYQCYDPDFSKRSLGIFMILESIKRSIMLNKDFYYPGYAYKEPSHYDYKKRFSATEYFNWNDKWLDLRNLSNESRDY